ncbi:MAG: tetratricopeptide repeat protein [Phycisphaerae bacterium]
MRTDRGHNQAAAATSEPDRPSGRGAGMGQGDHGRRGSGVTVAVVVFVAFAIRLAHVSAILDLPTTRHLVGDAQSYFQWAQRIAAGDVIGHEAFYQAPLYPYVLAAVLFAGAGGVTAVLVTQAVWGALGAALLVRATRIRFGAAAGAVAGIMAATYGPAVFFDGTIQKASLSFLLISGLVWLLAEPRGARRWARRMGVGVVLGLLILTRENAIVWVPLLLGWSAWSGGAASFRRMMLRSATFLAGLAVVLAPVGVRNAMVAGEFSVSTFQAGPNFYIGNGKAATGRYVPLVRGHETPEFERRDATELAERAEGRSLSARSVSRYWMNRAWRDITAAPGRWLRLVGLKLALVLNAYEIADVESLYVVREVSPVLACLSYIWHFGTLFPLAMAGLWCTRTKWRTLWIDYGLLVAMVAAVALFYVMARYRFPLVPLLIPFAAAGAVGLYAMLRSTLVGYGSTVSRTDTPRGEHDAEPAGTGAVSLDGKDRLPETRSKYASGKASSSPAVVLMVIAVVGVNVPLVDEHRLDALAFMNYGVAYAADGSLGEAEAMFQRAVRNFPDSPDAQANLAQVLALSGRYSESIPHYEAALDVAPELPGIYYNLGVALEHVGRFARARAAFQRAVEVDPADGDARAALLRFPED